MVKSSSEIKRHKNKTIFELTNKEVVEDSPKGEIEEQEFLLNNIFEVIVEIDENEKILYTNPQVKNLFGYESQEIIGKNALHYIHPDDLDQTCKKLRESFISNTNFTTEFRLIHKDGYYIQVFAKGIIRRVNKKKRAFLIIKDVSEQKSIEIILNESAKRYEVLYNNSPYAILLLDYNHVISDCNIRMEKLFGYTRSDLIGKNCSTLTKLFTLELDLICKERFDGFLNTKPIKPVKFQIQKKSGELTWVKVYFSSIEIAGKIFFQIIMQDIKEEVLNEQKLKDSEYKYRLITENANDMICVLNHKFKYTYINEQTYLKFLRYSNDDLIGKSAWKFMHHEDINNCLKKIGGKGDLDENKTELRVKHKDGNWVWIQVNIRRFRDEVRGRNQYLLVSREITNQKQAEDELKESEMKFRTLFNSSTSGIAYHKVVYDENSNPINYTITDVNPQSENILRIKKADVINKLATDIYKVENAPYLDIYSKVVESQESLAFESYYPPMDKHFKISVIPSKEGEFITVFEDISERKKSSLKLKESEKKYRQLVENAQEGIWALDKNAETTFVNPKMAEILGYSADEMFGKPLFYFMNNRGIKIAENNLERRKQGIQDLYDFEFLRKDGKRVFTRLEDSPMFDENDEYVGSLACVADITKQKLAERKLKKSEEKYRELVNNANSIILKWDINGKINFINEFGESFFGYANSELVGKHVIGTIVPKKETSGRDLEKLMSYICTNPERFKSNVNENITKDGKTVWISWTNKAIDDDHGELIGILSVGNDITDRKITEQKIKESEEKFRTITEQSFIGICIIKHYKFIYVNKQFSETLGYSAEELLNWVPRTFFNVIHPEDRVRILEAVEGRNLETKGVISNIQFRITKKTGEIIWLEVISKPFTYQGKSASLIATLDITEKIKAEKIILEENKKLVELNQMRKDIITRVSHELKTPLTSMYGASQILLKYNDEELSDNVLKFVEIFHRGALRLKKLVENLIDASRIETGKLDLKLRTQNLVEIVKECVDEMSYLLDNRRLFIHVELPEEVILEVDKIRLQQVITNILSNAIKNTPLQGTIFIKIIENSDHVDIEIRDTGIGITEKEKGLLFEKFGKIERYGKDQGVDIEGSGLGLYISKEIIELHGGQILVESKGRNKGALFTIRLYKRY